MTPKRHKKTSAKPQAAPTEKCPERISLPVNVVNGIPDRAEIISTSGWALPAVLIIFAGWMAILISFLLAGRIVEGV